MTTALEALKRIWNHAASHGANEQDYQSVASLIASSGDILGYRYDWIGELREWETLCPPPTFSVNRLSMGLLYRETELAARAALAEGGGS